MLVQYTRRERLLTKPRRTKRRRTSKLHQKQRKRKRRLPQRKIRKQTRPQKKQKKRSQTRPNRANLIKTSQPNRKQRKLLTKPIQHKQIQFLHPKRLELFHKPKNKSTQLLQNQQRQEWFTPHLPTRKVISSLKKCNKRKIP